AGDRRPFWSVMIPTYNPRADYLEETLWSVLKQDPGPDQMQIEVIDDASPKGAPTEFIRKLAGKRVTVHCEPRNLGLAGIWNRCASKFPFFYEPKILACWRNHSGATTSRQIRTGENIRDITKAIGVWRKHLPEGEAQRLAEIAANRFSYAGFWLARHLLGQNDFEASLNQLDAALACKSTFRLQLSAAKIRAKVHAKRILKWRQPRLASASP